MLYKSKNRKIIDIFLFLFFNLFYSFFNKSGNIDKLIKNSDHHQMTMKNKIVK